MRKLQIKGAKDGLIVDATDCAKLREIQVTGTPNLTIRQHPDARFKLIVSKSYFSSLSSLGVEQATSLYLEDVRLRDIDLLGKVSPSITSLSITVEAGDVYGADGLRYRPLPLTTPSSHSSAISFLSYRDYRSPLLSAKTSTEPPLTSSSSLHSKSYPSAYVQGRLP